MFHRTLNVPPHGGEEIQDNSMYTFAGRHINKDIQDNFINQPKKHKEFQVSIFNVYIALFS